MTGVGDCESTAASAQRLALREWIALFANVSVILTVAVMWLIYIGERTEARALNQKQVALQMLTPSYDPSYVATTRRVSGFILANKANLDRASIAEASGEALPALAIPESTLNDLMTITDYFDDVLICRESGNCDPASIDAWFNDDICKFTNSARLIGLPQLATGYGPEYGVRLKRYFKDHC